MVLSKSFEQLDVGDTFATGTRTIDEADVLGFAEQTGDRQPLHMDPEWAASSMFGERVAHGMLVLSCALGLMPLDPARALALRRVADALFTRPVKLGDAIRVEGRVLSLVPLSEEAGLVTLRLRVLNQDDRVVCSARIEMLWRRQ